MPNTVLHTLRSPAPRWAPRRPIQLAVVLTVLAAPTISACSAPSTDFRVTGAAASTAEASASLRPPPSGPNDVDAPPPVAPAPATQDPASSAAAVDKAVRAMTAFARPTLGAAAWFADLEPLLTVQAHSAYYGTDPTQVPAHAVTGPGHADGSPSAYLAYVTVPTDVGDYRVLLSRESGDSGWLVETLTPPGGVH